MKLFLALILIAAVVGGLIGGEVMGRSFSITGATIGGVGLAATLLALGALFHAQDERKRRKALSPEMRAVFDRMFGKSTATSQTSARQTTQPQPAHTPGRSTEQKAEAVFFSTASTLLPVQLMPKYPTARAAFGDLMTNKRALGYLFGFHDCLLQRFFLVSAENPKRGLLLMEKSFKSMFGEQAGSTLHWTCLNLQDDPEFIVGRAAGGGDVDDFIDCKVPALGLNRIVVLGLEA